MHALANLENTVRAQAARTAIGTPASTELLASLDALTSDRRDRLAAASHQLPVFYVVVLVLAGVALIVNASALTLRSGRRSALLTGSLASVIGLSLALLFARHAVAGRNHRQRATHRCSHARPEHRLLHAVTAGRCLRFHPHGMIGNDPECS